MKLPWFRSRTMTKLCFSILLVLIASLGIHWNQNSSVLAQSRTDTFNRAETLNLKRQIRQLEGEIRRLNRANTRSNSVIPDRVPRSTFNNPPVVNNQPVGHSDPMFERLATLLIELKEDVRNLDKRMTAIEQKLAN